MAVYQDKENENTYVIIAHPWHRNGDHPEDECRVIPLGNCAATLSEGLLVRYYRNPSDSGDRTCEMCGQKMHFHGWIDTIGGGHVVCPGNYIITEGGSHYPCTKEYLDTRYVMVIP